MIGYTRAARVWAWPEPVDMRAGFDRLFGLVAGADGFDAMSGDYYLFVNARRNRAKVLLYDGTGLCIYHKRLERGRFAAPWARARDGALQLTLSELGLFLEGCRLVGTQPLSPPTTGMARMASAA